MLARSHRPPNQPRRAGRIETLLALTTASALLACAPTPGIAGSWDTIGKRFLLAWQGPVAAPTEAAETAAAISAEHSAAGSLIAELSGQSIFSAHALFRSHRAQRPNALDRLALPPLLRRESTAVLRRHDKRRHDGPRASLPEAGLAAHLPQGPPHAA